MKILLAHARYALPGGEERVVDMQEAVLTARGHHVVRFEEANEQLDVAGLPAQAHTAARTVWSRRARRGVAEMIAAERPDVVHVHNFFPALSPSVYAAANAAGVPVVQHLHNARLVCMQPFLLRDGKHCDDCVGGSPLPGVLHRCYRGSLPHSAGSAAMLLTHRALGTWRRRVDLYVAVSQSLADTVRAGSVVPADRIAVCHNAIAEDPGARDDARDEGYALFAGRLSPEKGVDTILAAAAQVPDLPIVIAGDGPARATLAGAAPPHVRFVGHLDRARVAHLMRGARVVLSPSIGQEPFGMTVIEAAALGVATIASTAGALPELIDDGATGILVPPARPDALAAALRRARDAPAMATLGRGARAAFEARFTAEAFATRLLALYETLLPRN